MDFEFGKKIKNKSLLNRFKRKKPEEEPVSLLKLMQEKKYDEALKLHESVLKDESAEDWYTKGYLLRKLNKIDAPIECYDKAISLDQRYVKAWYRKGQCLLTIKKFLESAKCFEKVMEIEEENVDKGKKEQWSAATVLSLMVSYISEFNKLTTQNKLTTEVKESTDLWKEKCFKFFKDNNIISESSSESEFLENSIENFDKLLEHLEPSVAEEYDKKSSKRFNFTRRNKIIIGVCIAITAIILYIRLVVFQEPIFTVDFA